MASWLSGSLSEVVFFNFNYFPTYYCLYFWPIKFVVVVHLFRTLSSEYLTYMAIRQM